MIHPSDVLAQPRDAAHSMRLPLGEWEYVTAYSTQERDTLTNQGWKVTTMSGDDRWLLKFTHKECIR